MSNFYTSFPILSFCYDLSKRDQGVNDIRENRFQAELIKELKWLFEDCVVLKNDANYIQGFPDLLILFNDRWAALECKSSLNASRQINQEHYIDSLNKMSFAAFISPENREEILNELQYAFGSSR